MKQALCLLSFSLSRSVIHPARSPSPIWVEIQRVHTLVCFQQAPRSIFILASCFSSPHQHNFFLFLWNKLGASLHNTRNIRDTSSIPGLGGFPGEGHGNLLWYSCLENPMDREDWWATVHGVAKSRDRWGCMLEQTYIFCPVFSTWWLRANVAQTLSLVFLYVNGSLGNL